MFGGQKKNLLPRVKARGGTPRFNPLLGYHQKDSADKAGRSSWGSDDGPNQAFRGFWTLDLVKKNNPSEETKRWKKRKAPLIRLESRKPSPGGGWTPVPAPVQPKTFPGPPVAVEPPGKSPTRCAPPWPHRSDPQTKKARAKPVASKTPDDKCPKPGRLRTKVYPRVNPARGKTKAPEVVFGSFPL